MQVILKENIDNLGRVGDVVKVADGYARNYLLPRQLVAVANQRNKAEFEHFKKMLDRKRQAQKLLSEELAQKLNEFTCVVKKKVGEKDKLFGSVSVTDIAQAIKEAGFEVDRKAIHIETPIKSLGSHTVKVKLESDLVAKLKITVEKEE